MSEIIRIQCGIVNSYIVKEGANGILVDVAMAEHEEKILAACKDLKIGLILLTHGHMDHVQNAAALSKRLHAPIAMHEEDFELVKDNLSRELKGRGSLGKILLTASKSSLKKDKIPPFFPKAFLEEGDSLEVYGISAKVLELPGHTRGSIGLDIDNSSVIVGDALMNMVSPCPSLLYEDKEEMFRSARKITELGDRTVYFGHGKPVENREWV